MMYSVNIDRPTRLELVAANLALSGAVITIAWQTIGLSFIPGFDQMFGGPESQFPREVDSKHNPLYFAMYGALGCISQYCSLKVTTDKTNRNKKVTKTNKRRIQMLGLFHTIMAGHHLLWAFKPNYGRLRLKHLNSALMYPATGLLSLLCGIYGLQLLNVKEGDNLSYVIRRKITLDLASFSAFVPLLLFLPENWFEYRNQTVEKYAWLVSMIAPVSLFAANFFGSGNDDDDHDA